VNDTQQLLRLRTLRVQRVREQCGVAQAALAQAAEAVHERQRAIARGRRAIESLAHRVVHALAPRMPRWADVVAAERERLADRLERDEYALIQDEHGLEEAQERLQQARADLTRAMAREEAVRGLAEQALRAAALLHEQRVERELEDQGRVPGARATRRLA